MTEELLGFLGLMRRAGALALGAEDAFDAARMGKARLLCLAQDAARNTRDGMKNAAAQREPETPLLELDADKALLGKALGCGQCAAFALLDTGFALSFCKKLGREDCLPALEERLAREKKRKAKKEAQKKPAPSLPPGAKSGAAGRIAAKGRRRASEPVAGPAPAKGRGGPKSGRASRRSMGTKTAQDRKRGN